MRNPFIRRGEPTFASMSEEEVEAHLAIARYGDFELTEAIRPAPGMQPREGYRLETHIEAGTGARIPAILASASKEKLFDLFREMTELVAERADAVIDVYDDNGRRLQHAYREAIDMPVLQSTLLDYEDLLTNDGCLAFSVLNGLEWPDLVEVQLDDHKLLTVYARERARFEDVLRRFGIRHDQSMRLLTEAEHVHVSNVRFEEPLRQLRLDLGEDGDDGWQTA